MSSIEFYIERLSKKQLLKESEARDLCNKAKEIFHKEPNVLTLKTPITVCGDIHGQFDDLLELFEVGGYAPETNYIFMGDFVDRGPNSIETFFYLLAYKIKYPDKFALIRGNHETRQISQIYGFYEECRKKYNSSNIWQDCTEVFDLLPLAGVIDNKIYCVHGGLSPSAEKIDIIREIDRNKEVPHEGAMCDLLWSDPDPDVKGFSMSTRGAGFLFGADEVERFNRLNNIKLIARAHQLVLEGYSMLFKNTLVTVWSAPNYCGRSGNVASIMEFDEHGYRYFKIFDAAPSDERRLAEERKIIDYFL